MAPLGISSQRITSFDCENMPLNYLSSDFTAPSLTAISWQTIGKDRNPHVRLLPEDEMIEMLEEFDVVYDISDIVTGHNIRRHDLPLLQAMRLECGLSPLKPKMVCDTWADLKKRSAGFASQQTLAAMLGVRAPKVGMSAVSWREANRLIPEGVEKTRKRVTGDVKQHIQMRAALLERNWLRPPKMWCP